MALIIRPKRRIASFGRIMGIFYGEIGVDAFG